MVNGMKCGQGEEVNLNTKTRAREGKWGGSTAAADDVFFCIFTWTCFLFHLSHRPELLSSLLGLGFMHGWCHDSLTTCFFELPVHPWMHLSPPFLTSRRNFPSVCHSAHVDSLVRVKNQSAVATTVNKLQNAHAHTHFHFSFPEHFLPSFLSLLPISLNLPT